MPIVGQTDLCRGVTMFLRRALTPNLKRPNLVQPFDDIPSPKGLPFIGTTLSLLAKGSVTQLHKYIDGRHEKLGPIFKERLGPVDCVFVSDPYDIREVYEQEGKHPMNIRPEAWVRYNELYGCPRGLFFMDGANWWHHRRIVNSHLLKGDFKWIQDACEIVSGNFVKQLQRSDGGSYENLERSLYKWSMDTVTAILLGAEPYQKHHEDLEEEVTKLAQITRLIFEATTKLSLISASTASKLKIPQWNRFVNTVDNVLEATNSLVSSLMKILNDDSLLRKLLRDKIPPEDMKRIIVDLILASGDSMVASMQWMLYLAAKHKQTQEKLRKDPSMAKYVMREAMRLYPIATFGTRILPEDSVVAGYEIPKHTLVCLSMYTSGRDERYYKNANSFLPERWDRKDGDYHIDMQKGSLPFGIGLRSCVGRKLAERQLQTTILDVAKNFDVEIYNERDVEPVMRMIMVPSEPLKLKFNKL